MKAVHFGAGNIGRGFVGLLLHQSGYEVVFADVAAPLIEAISGAKSYTVHEVGEGGGDELVTRFRAINSAIDKDTLVDEIATANIVTTAVGPSILKFVAPAILEGLALRDPSAPPLQIMACENAINATDLLHEEIQQLAGDAWNGVASRAVFANTAVDRIVPGQPEGQGIDVTVETFYEWAIELPPFGDDPPRILGAHFVDDLAPYIERKLFTVNTGHATTAYYGARAGIERISDALADLAILAAVTATLEETSALLIAKHGLDPEAQAVYRATILERFQNPHLPDTVWRVGRQPLRKLSRHERFVGPAAEASDLGLSTTALEGAMGAALEFDVTDDEQSVDLQWMLRTMDAPSFTAAVTGLEPDHPLFDRVRALVEARQAALGA